MNRTVAKKILAFLLAALIALSALSGVVMVFAEDPVPQLAVIDDDLWHLSGRTYQYYFNTDVQGLALPAGFWEHYQLEAEILEGEDGLKVFELTQDEDGTPILTVEAEDGFVAPLGGNTVRYRLRCVNKETGALLCYNTFLLRTYLCETASEPVTVSLEDQLEAVTFPEEAQQGELLFEDTASFTFPLSEKRTFFPGWSNDYTDVIESLAQQHGVSFDVLNVLFTPVFDQAGELIFYTGRPYLYLLEDGNLIPVSSSYHDGAHHVTTDRLGCYLASSQPIDIK